MSARECQAAMELVVHTCCAWRWHIEPTLLRQALGRALTSDM